MFWLWIAVFFILLFFFFYLYWFINYKTDSKKEFKVLAYHKIHSGIEPGITFQTPGNFYKQMKFLFENGYETVNLKHLLKKTSADRKRILITFDDGYESIYNNAYPIMQGFEQSGCVFIITGFVGEKNKWDYSLGKRFQHLSWEQIQEMQRYGFEFGSHTVSHRDLTKLKPPYVKYELEKSKKTLEDKLGKAIIALSYPFGRFNEQVQEIAQNVGYKLVFGFHPQFNVSENPDFPTVFRMPIYRIDNLFSLKTKIGQGSLYWLMEMRDRIINQFSIGTTLVKPKAGYRVD